MTEYVRRGHKRKIDLAQATSLYNAGCSMTEIASFFGVTRQAVYGALERNGIYNRFRRTGMIVQNYEELKKAWRKHAQEEEKARNEKWRVFQMKTRVRSATLKAIAEGKLLPQPCEVCGCAIRLPNGNRGVQAHHDNYTKPLEVRWLCPKHHSQWHVHNEAKY
jgi:predicted DNA-binding protein YlxM (UPF0122 family)